MTDQPGFPFELDDVLNRIESSNKIMVLGGMDTGKTTLIRKLHGNTGGSIIDGDLGQPEIGPPGLISLGTYRNGVEDGYFVGSFTPRGNLVQVMTGIAKMLSLNWNRCFVDTDGWIEGNAAGVYKGELIGLVEPDSLILLQREDELEKFCTYLPEERVIRLKAQEKGEKPRGERSANRIRKFKYYFSRSRRFEKSWDEIRIVGTLLGGRDKIPGDKLEGFFGGRVLAGWKSGNALAVISGTSPGSPGKLKEKFNATAIERHGIEELKYRLVGCYSGSKFSGEGTITDITPEGIEVLAPEEDFDALKPGKERVKPSGRSLN